MGNREPKGNARRAKAVRAAAPSAIARQAASPPTARAASADRSAGRRSIAAPKSRSSLAAAAWAIAAQRAHGGRAGNRVVFRLPEKFHRGGQAVLDRGKHRLDVQGHFGLAHPGH